MIKIVVLVKDVPLNNILDACGFIPHWLNEYDSRPAALQLGSKYVHGGGWRPFSSSENPKFKVLEEDMSIKYPGDPRMRPFVKFVLRHEEVYMYQSGWVMVWNTKTKHHEICRMD